MAVNQVYFGNETLMDITDTTAEQDGVRLGDVFYGANGERQVGTAPFVGPYTSDPAPLGNASPGSSDDYARGDHVHPTPSPSDVGAVNKTGDTMSGALNMGSNKITGLADGTNDSDAVNLGQMTEAIKSGASYFRGSFNTKAALMAVQWQTSNPSGPNYVTNNDYAIVQADESHNNECWRYIYVSGSGWTDQYKIDDTPLTQAQIDALNSGATAVKINKIATLESNVTELYGDISDIEDMIAGQETSMTATKAYLRGDLLIVNGDLYRAIAPIANGATITVNTNVVLTDVDTELKSKAIPNGTYPDMTVGNAEQLVATIGVEDKVPYNFRTSGGSADIGDREVDEIVGGTVVWKQICSNGNFSSTSGWTASNATLSVENNIATLTVSASGGGISRDSFGYYGGHKYLTTVTVKVDSGSVRIFGYSFSSSQKNSSKVNEWDTVGIIWECPSTPANTKNSFPRIYDYRTNRTAFQVKNYMVFDLTRMFGSTIADYIYSLETATPGAGVAWFKKLFPKDYYAYNAGALMSVKTSAHRMTGFNQWDEEWELGDISGSTGQKTSGSYVLSKNYIPVISGYTYYFKRPSLNIYLYFYDADKTFIPRGTAGYVTLTNSASTYAPPENARFMKFVMAGAYGTTYKHDVCINLHWDGEKDGTYEPYELHSYALSDIELRGIPKLDADNKLYYDGDTYASDGTVMRKYGIVDLGTLNWSMSTGFGGYFAAALIVAKGYNSTTVPNIICPNYTTVKHDDFKSTSADKVIDRYYSSKDGVNIKDSAYSDAAAFKTAMNGVYLVYELATPTTESADPFTNPQIVNDFGTEEYVDAAVAANVRDVAIPVGHDTTYLANLRAKLEMAPNSPEGDGDYIVRQTSGENVYVPITLDAGDIAYSDEATYPNNTFGYVFGGFQHKFTLDGKVVSILGDSISTYDGWTPVSDGHNLTHRNRYINDAPWYTGTVDDTWWKKLIDSLGATLGINDSWAGSKVSNQSATNTGDVGPDACMAGITRITNLGANGTPDIIFFYGGTNDAGTSVTIGSFDSTATYTLDLTTNIWNDFATAYKDAIMRLQHFYPLAKIIVLLPTYTTSYYTTANLDKYNEIIKEICDYFGVDWFDLRRCGINYANLATTLGDGVHPTVKGFALMENYIVAKLFSVMRNDGIENVVYTVTNSLSVNVNSDRYIKGVSSGNSYSATITGNSLNLVKVFMGGEDITSTVYNSGTGVISIPSVTGNVVISDATTITWYTNYVSLGTSPADSNINGYGWCPNVDSELLNKPINIVRFMSASNGGTFEIGVVNALNGTTITKVQSVPWSSSDKDSNNIVTVILPNDLTITGTEMIVISPNTQPNYQFKYAIRTGSSFKTRVPYARDSGASWGNAANATLRHDFGHIEWT